jgi:alkanesulfonate monooxygenase
MTEFRIFCEPQQGATYDDLLGLALASEEAGFDAFFRSDHFLKMRTVSGLPGPTDAWITLAGLARETSHIRLGTLMTSATFRHPGPLAVSVAQVDVMSNGRVEFGLGAGWYQEEHSAYGIPFPSTRERFEMLEEQLAIITGLWSADVGSEFNYVGKHYSLTQCPALPKPQQNPRPPIIIGGTGPDRTPHLAAAFANEFNIPFTPFAECKEQFSRVDKACESIDRDPATLIRSVAVTVCCGETSADVQRRAHSIGRDSEELSRVGLVGTPSQLADQVHKLTELGITRIYLQFLDISDFDQINLLSSQVIPLFK